MGKNQCHWLEQTQPITGGNAPAAPPGAMFWGEFSFLSQTVYTNM